MLINKKSIARVAHKYLLIPELEDDSCIEVIYAKRELDSKVQITIPRYATISYLELKMFARDIFSVGASHVVLIHTNDDGKIVLSFPKHSLKDKYYEQDV